MVPPRVSRLVAALALACALTVAVADVAGAARLAGGTPQAALRRAFTADHADRTVVSIRTSTVDPGWGVVTSVRLPRRPGSSPQVRRPVVARSYFHLVGGRERAARPSGAVLGDLRRRFTVVATYAGSGSESIVDAEHTAGVCAGQGGFDDTETVDVSPMRWSVRYVIAPDDVLSATRGRSGIVIVPRISFGTAGSSVTAVERLRRTIVDTSCAGKTTRYACTRSFGVDPGTSHATVSAAGLQVGVPTRATSKGACAAVDYTLGSTLWSDGATTAVVRSLPLEGGRLPSNPYRPVALQWPGAAVPDLATSPCTGDAACHDTFAWTGSVTLSPGAGG